MGQVRIPSSVTPDERVEVFGTAGTWEDNDEGVLIYTDDERSYDELQSMAQAEWGAVWTGRLPIELRVHVVHIRDMGLLDAAGLAGMTEAQVRHVVRDLCRAMALLVDRRLE